MSLAEGTQCSLAYKAYSTGVISSNSQPTSSSDPGASGGQFIRRVSSTMKLGKDTYRSNEMRPDRQIADFRHGVKRASGQISGEFSPATYWDLFEASLRGTKAAAVTASQSDFTSVIVSGSTFVFAAGNPHTKGFRVGDIIQFTNLLTSANNSKNFLILSLGGSNNRTVTVYPTPDAMTTDSAFTVAQIGKSLYMPSTSFVSRKFALEHQFTDIDYSHLFTECRVGGFNIQLPATGLATVDFNFMGRDMELYAGGAAPFFTAPTAVTTTGIFAAVNGLLRVGGSTVGVVTGLNVQLALNPESNAVVGQNYVPEIFLAPADITGQITAMLEDNTLVTSFKNETEVEILCYLTTTSDSNTPAASIYLPRVKLGDAAVAVQGGAAQTLTIPFQALKYATAGSGIEATTIRLCDTQAT